MLMLMKMVSGAASKVAPWVWGFLAALIVASLLWWSVHSSAYNEGANSVIVKAEKEHATQEKKADRAESRVNDCFASDGDWDTVHSVCLHHNR